jgi:CubicO group peptidase (beta-lactamase class C family)
MFRRLILPVILSIALAGHAITPEQLSKINEIVQQYHEMSGFGGVVLVAENGKIAYEKGFGMANVEWNIPNSPAARYRIGSITKQFTAMLVMQLVQEEKLKLDGTISEYLPWYRQDTGSQVTLHHLLTHTSGIPNYTMNPVFQANMRLHVGTPKEFVLKYCSGDLEWKPGEKYGYNNSGYFLLGAILEQVTGKKYETLLHERIFGPLGMMDSGFDHSEAIIPRRASGYQLGPKGELRNAEYLDMEAPFAGGSIYSTVDDLLKWDQALYTDSLLSAELKKKMFTPVLEEYGYGWVIEMLPKGAAGELTIWHPGGINGFNADFLRLVNSRRTIIVLGNHPARVAPVTEAINKILHDLPVEPIKGSGANP